MLAADAAGLWPPRCRPHLLSQTNALFLPVVTEHACSCTHPLPLSPPGPSRVAGLHLPAHLPKNSPFGRRANSFSLFARPQPPTPPHPPPRSPARRCAILTGAVAGYRWLRNWRISWLPNCLSIWPASRLLLKTKDNCKICPCPCRVVGCPISAERFFSERSRGPQEEKSKHGRLRPKEAIRGADKPSHRG